MDSEEDTDMDINAKISIKDEVTNNAVQIEEERLFVAQGEETDVNLRNNEMAKVNQENKTKLAGNTFVITNKEYPRKNLAQWGNGEKDCGPYEDGMASNQLWILEEDIEYPDHFHIKNVQYDGYKLSAEFSSSGVRMHDVGVRNDKEITQSQIWRFVKEKECGGDGYRIFNFEFSSEAITILYSSLFGITSDNMWNRQLWKLIPRFEAKVEKKVIWEVDNRQGSRDITEKVEYSEGLKLTQSSEISTQIGMETSLTLSVDELVEKESITSTLKTDISTSIKRGSEKTWSKKVTTTYNAPAGKNYRVVQLGCNFDSPLQIDNMYLDSTHIQIQETDGDFPN